MILRLRRLALIRAADALLAHRTEKARRWVGVSRWLGRI